VKIETPNGWGTGFLAFWNHDRNGCGIATAAHVLKHTNDWQQPIKVIGESRTPLAAPRRSRCYKVQHSNGRSASARQPTELRRPANMTSTEISRAIVEIARRFPFEGYMAPDTLTRGAYTSIAGAVQKYVKPGSTILDFGCGSCDKTAVLQLLGYKCSGYDDLQDEWHKIPGNREKILKFAADQGITLKQAASGPMPFEKESFDLVMANDVLEHLHDSPRELFNDLLELTKPNGLLLITVPNAVNIRKRIEVLRGGTNLPRYEGYYWYPGAWRGHIREYVEGDLRQMTEFLGLEIVELRGCDHMLEKVPPRLRSPYLAVTSIFQGWKDSWLLIARKPAAWKPRRTLPDSEIAHILGKASSYQYER
jgi:SAM-dependent methyltransferase